LNKNDVLSDFICKNLELQAQILALQRSVDQLAESYLSEEERIFITGAPPTATKQSTDFPDIHSIKINEEQSLVNASASGSIPAAAGAVSAAHPVEDTLEWLRDAIPMIGTHDIKVVTTFMGVSRKSPGASALVVLYEDLTAGIWLPPERHGIVWEAVNKPTSTDDDNAELFLTFCYAHPLLFDKLMVDFFSDACLELLNDYRDSVCIYPTVRMMDEQYEPFIMSCPGIIILTMASSILQSKNRWLF